MIKTCMSALFVISSLLVFGQTCEVSGLSSSAYADITQNNIIVVDLSWSILPSAEKYQAQIFSSGSISVSDSTTSNMVSMEFLQPNATYIWRVRAKCNGSWESWPSWQDSFNTPSGVLCEVSGHNAVTSVDGSQNNVISATLSWSSNSIADEYQAQIYYNEDLSVSEVTTNTNVTMSNLFPNVNYLWRIRVKCNGEWNDWPDWQSSFNTPSGEVCEASGHTSDVSYDVATQSINAALSWSTNPIAEEYQVQIVQNEVTSLSAITTSTQVTMTDLISNVNYLWRIRVRCNGVWSEWPSWQSSFDTPSIPNAWINEIHYDNAGVDVEEFVEIVIENVGNYSPLTDFTVTLYNGSNGAAYTDFDIDPTNPSITGDTVGDFSFYAYTFPSNGIQNGPDAIALDYKGVTIQFISYEGHFTAADGVAQGIESTDILVSESGATAVGTSLQLCCDAFTYADMEWQTSASQTKGSSNLSQILPVQLAYFKGEAIEGEVILEWQTYSELNNDYFLIERSADGIKFEVLGIHKGNGTSDLPNSYTMIDKSPSSVNYYRMTQVDFDGTKTIYEIIRVTSMLDSDITIFPNPASQHLTIQSSTFKTAELRILDLSGKEVTKRSIQFNHGIYTLDVKHFDPGIYTIHLNSGFESTAFRVSIY